jgi:4-amino-4-deoxy-L-arabinose transferase-like glycosyltransferase
MTLTAAPVSPKMPPVAAALAGFLAALTVIRLVGLRYSAADLFVDEAQYWSWSRELAFGYFSKPPLLAWLIAAAEAVCGDGEACIRAPAPILYFLTSLIVYALGRALYDTRTGLWAALLTALGPGAIFSARIVSTDVPALTCWALALYAYMRLRTAPDWRWGLLLGLALGFGMLAKYAVAYFLAGMVLAAIVDPDARALLKRPALWLGLAVAVLVLAPNLVWNAVNGFVTLRNTSDVVLSEPPPISLVRPFAFLGAQFGVFGPVVFGAGCAALVCWRQLTATDRVLLAFALPPLALIAVVAVAAPAYANWAAVAGVSLTVLAAALLLRWRLEWLLWVSLALGLAVQGLFLVGDAFASRISIPLLKPPNPYARTLGWNAYAQAVGGLAERIGAPTIAADERADVAALLYYRRHSPQTILAWPSSETPKFEMTRALTAQAREPVLFVTFCPDRQRLAPHFRKIEPLGNFVTSGPAPRFFSAFRLEAAAGPIGPLAACEMPGNTAVLPYQNIP